jgi:hypothetical protein
MDAVVSESARMRPRHSKIRSGSAFPVCTEVSLDEDVGEGGGGMRLRHSSINCCVLGASGVSLTKELR